jgi:hypothetical protein
VGSPILLKKKLRGMVQISQICTPLINVLGTVMMPSFLGRKQQVVLGVDLVSCARPAFTVKMQNWEAHLDSGQGTTFDS